LLLSPAARRLELSGCALVLIGAAVHMDRIGRREVAAFRTINQLPDRLYPPVWLVMQSGSLAAVPLACLTALTVGRPQLAHRLAVAGTGSWLLAKASKRLYRRPRPSAFLPDTRRRGTEASGLGYSSGHAAVAAALACAAAGDLGDRARLATAVAVPVVGLCRIYVGAHLPLDVLGGVALGVAVDALSEQLAQPGTGSHGWRRMVRSLSGAERRGSLR
jgi:undecaprenyl-diphosphatase